MTSIERVDEDLSCDVLVIGSGVAGYCAAIQAGRCGCATVLIEKDEVLGGNSGPNLGVGITGADRYAYYAAETGIVHEIQEEGAWFDMFGLRSGAYTISRRFEALVRTKLEAAGVRVLKRHYARAPILADRRIAAVIVEDMAAFRTVRIDVRHVVIDASGDGEISARAGAEFAVGSEGRGAYGERSAPAEPSPRVQGSSLVAIAANLGRPVSFTPPPGTPPFKPRLWEGSVREALHHGHDGYCSLFRGGKSNLTFLYVTEAGGDRDTIRDDAAIYADLMRGLWAEWDHIKNGPHAADARNWDLLWVSPKAGKRESRRFLGDYVLTQGDLESGRRFADDVAYGGHNLDEHRILPSGHAEIHGHSVPPLYGIPFRSCYSRNTANLLLAGRLISASHLAHSSVRVMRTGGAVGQAVGLAAALCCRHACGPREIGRHHLAELQAELQRADGSLLDKALPVAGDLARAADITASSERRLNAEARPGDSVPLLNRLANLVHLWGDRLEAVDVFVENTADCSQPLEISVWRTREPRPWRPTDHWCKRERARLPVASLRWLASARASVEPRFRGWQRVEFQQAVPLDAKDAASDDDVLLVAVEANPALLWSASQARCEWMEFWEHREGASEWSALGATGTMRLSPEPRLGEASQVTDGFARRFSTGPTHMWMSATGAALPQDVVLSWSEPVTVARVRLTFDSLARTLQDNPWEHGPRALPYLVRDYAIDVMQGGTWTPVVSEAGNYHRLRTHVIESVRTQKLRLRVLAMHGEHEGARVYAIEVFAT